MRLTRIAAFGLVLSPFAVPFLQGPASAQDSAPVTAPFAQQPGIKSPLAPTPHAMTPEDVSAFFDGVVPLQLERSDIAGASVLVQQGDVVLLQKGYGFADQKKKQPVDPASTIFRLASISKLFTWTAVMQLVEEGKLDPDTDINKYLDFEVHPAFGKPITLRNLMTHTAGFEDTYRDIITFDPRTRPSLRDYLIRNQPARLYPPGIVPGYSNYGVGLAGYIVQRVSGQPFEQYIQDHIFTPLKMTGSSFFQPVQTGLSAAPSEGYRGDTLKPAVGFEIFNPAPAGGLSSTASDMGRFGRALLNGGTLDGAQILRPETVALMWSPQFRASDQLPPACMGFYQDWRNNTHWIGHEGDLIAFHSLFFMDPATKTTLFASYNSAGGGDKPRPELIDMFTDRYFPVPPQAQHFVSFPLNELREIEGTYAGTRRADSNRSRLGFVFMQRKLSVDKDGVLQFVDSKDLRGHPMRYRPIAKDLWEEIDGQHRLFAVRSPSGRIVRLAFDFPGVQAERIPWYQGAPFIISLIAASLLVLVCVLLAPLFRLGRRIFLANRPLPAPQPETLWLPLMTKLAALVWVIPLAITLVVVARQPDMAPPTSGWDKWFVLMNVVIALALFLSLSPIVSARRIWSRKHVRWITRIKFSIVAVACLALAWVSLYFHLIGETSL